MFKEQMENFELGKWRAKTPSGLVYSGPSNHMNSLWFAVDLLQELHTVNLDGSLVARLELQLPMNWLLNPG